MIQEIWHWISAGVGYCTDEKALDSVAQSILSFTGTFACVFHCLVAIEVKAEPPLTSRRPDEKFWEDLHVNSNLIQLKLLLVSRRISKFW
jgi:hypothetical protein